MACTPSKDSDQPWHLPKSDQSSLCAQWEAKDPSFLHADSEDSDETGRMPRLSRVSVGRTCHFVSFVMRWLNLLSHLLVAGCDIGDRSSVRLSTFMSKFDIYDKFSILINYKT